MARTWQSAVFQLAQLFCLPDNTLRYYEHRPEITYSHRDRPVAVLLTIIAWYGILNTRLYRRKTDEKAIDSYSDSTAAVVWLQ